jgi:hypothetical protein
VTPREVVLAFWEAMRGNDFAAAGLWLTEDFRLDWPQSGEVIRGRANFAAINTAYPASGSWRFDLRRLLVEGADVVTEVGVTDGTIEATAITFHEVRGNLIARQREFWPDPFDPPPWRAHWVEVAQPRPT